MSQPTLRAGRRSAARLFVEVARRESLAAARDRMLDRIESWLRLRRLTAIDPSLPLGATHRERPLVLNVSPVPPFPRRGGVQLQMLDRLEAVARTHAVCLLYPSSPPRWRLEWWDGRRRAAVDLDEGPTEIDAVVRAAVLTGTGAIHVENPAGLPIDLPLQLQDRGLDAVLSVHDYSPYCRRPHLMERPSARFCEFSTDLVRCASCLRNDWEVAEDEPTRHRDRAERALAASRAVVFPSGYALEEHRRLFPRAPWGRIGRVIAPATSRRSTFRRGAGLGSAVAVVGGLQLHKGALLLPQLVRRLRDRRPSLGVALYGGGDLELARRSSRVPGLRVRGYYRAGALPRLLAADGTAVAVLPSVWPETYGIVVDECLAADVPVVVFDLGAPAARLRGSPSAAVVDIGAGAVGLAEATLRLLDDPPSGAARPDLPTPEGAARAHLELYASLHAG